MRIKNDTILKWRNLADTMYLSNEEFGALIRNVMIEDDTKDIRHDYIPKDVLKYLLEKEEEWRKDFSELYSKNPQLIQAFITVYGQASHSHRAFDKLQEKYDTEDIENTKEKNKKAKTEKAKAETKVEESKAEKPKVSKTFQNDFINVTLKVSENCDITSSEIDEVTGYLESIEKYNEIESITITAIQKADEDNYKNSLMHYVMCQLEDEVMNNSKYEKDEFPF